MVSITALAPSPAHSVQRRRVLHVAQPAEGGVARYIDAVVGSQVERGWDVAVASRFDQTRREVLIRGGVQALDWQAQRSPYRGLRQEAVALKAIVASYRPDVVVLHAAKAGLVGRLCVLGEIPTVVMPHAWSFAALPAPLDAVGGWWERLAARWTHALVAVSEGEVSEGLDRRVFAPYFVVHNPVMPGWTPLDAQQRRDARSRLGLSDAPLVVCVGRLARQKGQDVLLAAWPKVLDAVPGARLALVGDGPLAERWREAAPADVIFTGWIDRPQPWVAAADVMVFPSRWEGLSLAMLEAMAAGRSIITTAVNGSELVTASGGGAVVPIEDGARLAEEIIARVGGSIDTDAEGARAARYAGEHHHLDVAVGELVAVLERAVAFGRPCPAPR